MTEQIRQLDRMLEDELLVFSGSEEDFEARLFKQHFDENSAYDLWKIFKDFSYHAKFMLYEREGRGYLRIQNKFCRYDHGDINAEFMREIRLAKINGFENRGGGEVLAKRESEQVKLYFGSESTTFGRFDAELLRKTLEECLDKRIKHNLK